MIVSLIDHYCCYAFLRIQSCVRADALTPVEYDAGILNTLSALDVRFLAVGHDHGNGYCCQHVDSEVHVCFGRHSGYGGYSRKNWSRGARVYELKFSVNGDDDIGGGNGNILEWSSWVRLEDGSIVDRYSR